MLKKYMALAFIAVLLVAGCGKADKQKADAKKTQGEERVINVQAKQVEKKKLKPYIETIGTLNPNDVVNLSSEADGVLKVIHVDEGSIVKKGDLLAELDDTDYKLDLRRNDAALKQTEITVANLRAEYQRKMALYNGHLVTDQQIEDISTRLSIAESEIEKAKVAIAISKQRLSKTKIYAPIGGNIKERKVSAGDFVRTGMLVFVIIQNDTLKLDFTVTEKDIGRIVKGQEVAFKVDPFPGKVFHGRVNIVYPNLDDRARTLAVEALVDNSKGSLKPGLFANILLYTGSPRDTLAVPVIALMYDSDKVKVYVVEGERVKERFVKTGNKHDELMEITEGLKATDIVVFAGQQNLSEGTKVNVAR